MRYTLDARGVELMQRFKLDERDAYLIRKYNLDQVCHVDSPQLTAIYARSLEQIRPTLYEKKYPELKARTLVPINNEIHPGAETYTVQGIDSVGEAEFIENYGTDAPTVEVFATGESSFKMFGIRLAYGWHRQEALAAQFAQRNLSDIKALKVRWGIERFLDKLLLIGGTAGATTLQGLFTLSGGQAPVTYTVQNTTWEDETPDEILADLMGIQSKIYVDSKEIEIPDTLVLPNTSYDLINQRRMGPGDGAMSILKTFLGMQDRIKQVKTSHYLEVSGGHSGGAVKRMVCYKNDREILEGFVNEFEQGNPHFTGERVVTTCFARGGGVGTHRPKAIAYGDNI
jgi:hypothetical protein